jgi:hypothetical protein
VTYLGSHFLAFISLYLPLSVQPGNLEQALVEPPGAYNLIHGSQDGSWEVAYDLEEPYPAREFLDWLTRRLTDLGWKPLRESWLNPGTPTSHTSGWSKHEDGMVTPSLRVDQWWGEWTNAAGAILFYVLKYSYPTRGEPIRNTLFVSAVVQSPEAAAEFQRQANALEPEVQRMLELEQQAEEARVQQEAAALRRRATSVGHLSIRLLHKGTVTPEPPDIPESSFDGKVPALELDVVHASVEAEDSEMLIRMVLSDASARELEKFSSTHVDRIAALIVDEEVVSTAFIASPLSDVILIPVKVTRDRADEIVDRIMN